mmetsp:Transcript_64598/g.135572  ORF Transcript_64598/g.135572 Transcript_64598/m.135572 type:complete len:204 (+) Transcript_64598:200-811(+)
MQGGNHKEERRGAVCTRFLTHTLSLSLLLSLCVGLKQTSHNFWLANNSLAFCWQMALGKSDICLGETCRPSKTSRKSSHCITNTELLAAGPLPTTLASKPPNFAAKAGQTDGWSCHSVDPAAQAPDQRWAAPQTLRRRRSLAPSIVSAARTGYGKQSIKPSPRRCSDSVMLVEAPTKKPNSKQRRMWWNIAMLSSWVSSSTSM